MNQSTSFAQVATNLLNVLQGYTKGIRLLLVMFLTLTVSAEVWAETATFTANSYGWTNGQLTGDPTTKTIGDVTFNFAGGSTKPTYYTADGLRTYEGCKITISSEATISSIAFTYTINNSGSLSATPGTWNSSTKKWSGSANTVTFTVGHSSGTKNGQIRITQIAVTYTPTVSCSNPTITTQPSAATYTKGATATALKVVASGDDLTYQWYSNTSNSTSGATKIDGATNPIYTPSTSTVGTKYYYCIVSSGSCSTTSNIVSVVVKNPTYTVIWKSNGVEIRTDNNVESGTNQTAPTISPIPCGDVIAGWTDAEIYVHGTSKLYSGATPSIQITGNKTFHAVFADYVNE